MECFVSNRSRSLGQHTCICMDAWVYGCIPTACIDTNMGGTHVKGGALRFAEQRHHLFQHEVMRYSAELKLAAYGIQVAVPAL